MVTFWDIFWTKDDIYLTFTSEKTKYLAKISLLSRSLFSNSS